MSWAARLFGRARSGCHALRSAWGLARSSGAWDARSSRHALILYDNPTSTNRAKVRFLLAELELLVETRTVELQHPTAEYLAVRRDPGARVRVDVLLDPLPIEVRPAPWDVERFVIYEEPAARSAIDRARARLSAALNAHDRLLDAGGPHALGGFTVADCAIVGRMRHFERLGLETACAPRLRRTLAAGRARSAWRRSQPAR